MIFLNSCFYVDKFNIPPFDRLPLKGLRDYIIIIYILSIKGEIEYSLMYQTFSMQLETNIRHLVNIWSQYLQCLVPHSAVSTQRGEWVAAKKIVDA